MIRWIMERLFGEWRDDDAGGMRRFKDGRWQTRPKTHREAAEAYELWLSSLW
jgi:transposase